MTDEDLNDQISITTITSTGLTPENVEAEAKAFAMMLGSLLMMAMSERHITERSLAAQLQCPPRQVRNVLLGETWKVYLPLAAMSLAVGLKLELRPRR